MRVDGSRYAVLVHVVLGLCLRRIQKMESVGRGIGRGRFNVGGSDGLDNH